MTVCSPLKLSCMLRVTQFSLPNPKGGKHTNNPVLCADQRGAQQRASRAGAKAARDVFSVDYMAGGASPFSATDITSRSALHGHRGHRPNVFSSKRNPNENNKVYGRRK